jgi:hypothetical protein
MLIASESLSLFVAFLRTRSRLMRHLCPGNDLYHEMIEGGVISLKDKSSKVALVYGQMNEPPGARARVALTGLTVAEYFRDQEGQDVLLFIDNIFRFTQVSWLPPTPNPHPFPRDWKRQFGSLKKLKVYIQCCGFGSVESIPMFWGLLDPDPSVRVTVPDTSIIKQNRK